MEMGFLIRALRHGRRRVGGARHCRLLISLGVFAAGCAPATESPRAAAAFKGPLEFTGSWNGAGSRHTIPLGEGRVGAIVDLTGTMLLAGDGRPGVGFHSEVIGLTDSATGFQGRSVWTDEHGDQVYSELKGEGTAAKNRIAGTILSGTGRYAGLTGSYEFSWQWVIEGEEGALQGRAIDLRGRVQRAGAAESNR
jgi:hypothetical protein